MGINKVQYGNTVLIDLTDTTAVASDVAAGKYFYGKDGVKTLGTGSGGGGDITVEALSVTQNGTYTAQTGKAYTPVTVSVPTPTPTLQTITKSYTPTESQQTETITAGSGYDGIEEVDVTVGAISSTYVGTGITRRSSSDLTASGATVTVPSGYYSAQASKAVTSGTAGTPTATKGTVSNHSVSVTPSVTNTSGYITGSTKTGTAVTVSASELVSGSETKTENGTYDVTNLAELVVSVSGGGSSSWTKVAETSYQVSTTSTSTTTVATWSTGHSEIWDEDKILYIRIRDTAGKRAGYFYGTDTFFMNFSLANSSSSTSAINGAVGNIWRCNTSGKYEQRYSYGTTNYGVYCDQIYSDGRLRIRTRYNSNYTLTVDGTYKVEVYLLDPPTGAPIFE